MSNADEKRVGRIAERNGFRLEKAGHGKGHGRFYIVKSGRGRKDAFRRRRPRVFLFVGGSRGLAVRSLEMIPELAGAFCPWLTGPTRQSHHFAAIARDKSGSTNERTARQCRACVLLSSVSRSALSFRGAIPPSRNIIIISPIRPIHRVAATPATRGAARRPLARRL